MQFTKVAQNPNFAKLWMKLNICINDVPFDNISPMTYFYLQKIGLVSVTESVLFPFVTKLVLVSPADFLLDMVAQKQIFSVKV